MPGFSIASGEVVQCVLRGELYLQETRNVLYFRYDDVNPIPVNVDVSVLHASLLTDLMPRLQAATSIEMEFVQADYRLLNPFFQFTWSQLLTLGGLVGGQSLPPAVTANTKRRTGLIGRTQRQRNYWPGIPETQHLVGKLTAAGLNLWGLVAQQLVTDLNTPVVGQTFGNVLCGIAPGGGPTTIRDLQFGLVDPILRSQRRREIGVGI